jgi:hypothetical protein
VNDDVSMAQSNIFYKNNLTAPKQTPSYTRQGSVDLMELQDQIDKCEGGDSTSIDGTFIDKNKRKTMGDF